MKAPAINGLLYGYIASIPIHKKFQVINVSWCKCGVKSNQFKKWGKVGGFEQTIPSIKIDHPCSSNRGVYCE